MAPLRQTPVAELRELSFPYPDDATDVFTLKIDRGTGYLDQGTGALLAWADLTGWERVSETIYMLHTGQGAATLGLVLGLMALGVPAMAATGILVWLAGRSGRPRIRGNQPAVRAETILLVGSEGGSTWGFAATLHAALTEAGQSFHVGPMSGFAPERYARAERIILLAATYGDGAAPASAKGFLDRLSALERAPDIPLALLGFGDRSFPAWCAFAKDVTAAAQAKGWPELLPLETVDRQSPQDFARWGRALGDVLGIALELAHQPVVPQTTTLTLVSRRDYGAGPPEVFNSDQGAQFTSTDFADVPRDAKVKISMDGCPLRQLGQANADRGADSGRTDRALGDQGRDGWDRLRRLRQQGAGARDRARHRRHPRQSGHPQERRGDPRTPGPRLLVPLPAALLARPHSHRTGLLKAHGSSPKDRRTDLHRAVRRHRRDMGEFHREAQHCRAQICITCTSGNGSHASAAMSGYSHHHRRARQDTDRRFEGRRSVARCDRPGALPGGVDHLARSASRATRAFWL